MGSFDRHSWIPWQDVGEIWKKKVLKAIDDRIKEFKYPPPVRSQRAFLRSDYTSTRNALGVTEILELILRSAPTETLIVAWDVSRKWRDVAEQVVESRRRGEGDFTIPYPCGPVDLGNLVSTDPEITSVQPTAEELEAYQEEISRMLADCRYGFDMFKIKYRPARLTQAIALSKTASAETFRFYRFQGDMIDWWCTQRRRDPRSRQPTINRIPHGLVEPRWIDLSQFRFNPNFIGLFPDRITFKHGRCEISLRPGAEGICSLTNSIVMSRQAEQALNIPLEFITQPPCKALRLSIPTFFPEMTDLDALSDVIREVKKEDGLRIGRVIKAMELICGRALSTWRRDAAKLRRAIEDDYAGDVWFMPPRPTICIQLTNYRNFDGRVWYRDTRSYWAARDTFAGPRSERQAAWMPVARRA